MKMQYISPEMDVRTIALEASIAGTEMSILLSGQIEDWEDGGTIGKETGDGGEIYVVW
jgi:hypothetical protein